LIRSKFYTTEINVYMVLIRSVENVEDKWTAVTH